MAVVSKSAHLLSVKNSIPNPGICELFLLAARFFKIEAALRLHSLPSTTLLKAETFVSALLDF